MNDKFLITDNEDTKKKLIKLGYELLFKQGSFYYFENSPTLSFTKEDGLKVAFINSMNF